MGVLNGNQRIDPGPSRYQAPQSVQRPPGRNKAWNRKSAAASGTHSNTEELVLLAVYLLFSTIGHPQNLFMSGDCKR